MLTKLGMDEFSWFAVDHVSKVLYAVLELIHHLIPQRSVNAANCRLYEASS